MLSPETYKAHAESCLLRPKMFLAEFDQTLRLPANVSRNISRFKSSQGIKSSEFSRCLRIAINDFVIFFNTFDRIGGVDLFIYLAGDINKLQIETLLHLFNLKSYDLLDDVFMEDLRKEIYQ